MKLNVQLFAGAKSAAGSSSVQLSLSSEATVAELRRKLVEAVPELEPLKDTLLVAVNNQYASAEKSLNATDEVACFPPVSGG